MAAASAGEDPVCFICSALAIDIEDFDINIEKFVQFIRFRKSPPPAVQKKNGPSGPSAIITDLFTDPEFKNFQYCQSCQTNLHRIISLLEELEVIQNTLVKLQQIVARQLKEAVQRKPEAQTRLHWYRGRILQELDTEIPSGTLTLAEAVGANSDGHLSTPTTPGLTNADKKLNVQPLVNLTRLEDHDLESSGSRQQLQLSERTESGVVQFVEIKQEPEDDDFDESNSPVQFLDDFPADSSPPPPLLITKRSRGRPRKSKSPKIPNVKKGKKKPDEIQKPTVKKKKKRTPKYYLSRKAAGVQKLRASLEIEDKEPKLHCLNCQKSYSYEKLWIHTKLEHEEMFMERFPDPESKSLTSKFKYQCKFCSLKTSRMNIAWFHIRCQHSKHVIRDYDKLYSPGTVPPPLKRLKTNYKANPSKTTAKRSKEDDGPPQFQCDLCPRTFQSIYSLNNHTRVNHEKGEPTFSCPRCPYKCSANAQLRAHIRNSHDKEYNIVCELCGKRFWNKLRYKEHMNGHTGAKPHVCNVCGKGYGRRALMKVHEATHSNDRPHTCGLCGFGFPSRVHLLSHHQSHHVRKGVGEGVKPKRSSKYNQNLGGGGRPPANSAKCAKEQPCNL